MPSGGTMPEVLIIRGDQVHCWKFAFVFMVWATILTPFLGLPLLATAPNTTSALLDMLMVWGGCALLALCNALWWCFVPGRTQYVCDGQTLQALRGGRVLKEIDCSTIRSLIFVTPLT